MTNEIIENEIYWCRKCLSETMTANPNCAKCGRKMQTQSTVKGLKKLLVGLGILITLGSGLGLIIAILIVLFAKFKAGEIVTAYVALAACGAFTLAGIVAIIGGLWQAKHGRTSKAFMWIFFGMIALILILGRIFSMIKG